MIANRLATCLKTTAKSSSRYFSNTSAASAKVLATETAPIKPPAADDMDLTTIHTKKNNSKDTNMGAKDDTKQHHKEEVPTLQSKPKYMYTVEFNLGDPLVVPNGPLGTRAIFELGGKAKAYGPAINGDFIGPSADWLHIRPDGSIFIDIRSVIKTDDGAFVKCDVIGISHRDEDDPNNSYIQSAVTFETGDEKYKYLNHKILVGEGRKTDKYIKMHYFDTSPHMGCRQTIAKGTF